MNVEKTSSAVISMRQDAAAAQKNKVDQTKQNEQKQAQAAADAKKTQEDKQGSTLKTGAINITA